MPPIQSKVEGRGNGIKTAIVNLSEVSRALGRPASYIVKYFGSELGAQTSMDEDKNRYLVNGVHDANELQDSLDGFINKFVLCANCKNPETEIQIKEKDNLQRDCKACGHVSIIDPRHKLSTFILKNPPAGAKGGKKGKKAATATANVVGGGKSISDIASGQQQENGSGDVGDDDDDVLTRKINAEAAALKAESIEVNDDDWAVDMSKEAIEARARELEGLSLQGDQEKYNELGEWILKGREEDELPSDVEIYKKIVELDILEEPETVQVLAQVLFDEEIVSELEEHAGLLTKLINQQTELEKAFMGGLERFLGMEKPELIPALPKILMSVYEHDIVNENVILAWGSKVSKKYVAKDISKKVRRAAKPFIKWLQEADEESDDDEE
ncbi:hypothetical protein QFC19_005170 [Naganishia cerealis]|nr:hypothetical protein QFC19_005170 [Naganishia cerealis]